MRLTSAQRGRVLALAGLAVVGGLLFLNLRGATVSWPTFAPAPPAARLSLDAFSEGDLRAALDRRRQTEETAAVDGPTRALLPDIHSHNHGEGATPICQQDLGRIGIFIVYTRYAAYGHASNTLRCYAESRGYDMIVVQPYEDARVQKACGWLKDIFFLKHCAASVYLKDYDWLYVSDADTAVVNSDHCIEEYLTKKNTQGGRAFLRGWSAMEAEKPGSGVFCSADNGLLHIHMLRTLFPDRPKVHEGCWAVLNTSIWPDYEPGYGAFLRCAKQPLIDLTPSPHARVKVRVIPRVQAWVRDTVFTGHDLWPGDFMAHGIKQSEPFDLAMLTRLSVFVNGTTPTECYNPAWAPKLAKGKMDTEESMRKRFRELGSNFESGKLKPIYADMHFEKCWPRCPMLVQNF